MSPRERASIIAELTPPLVVHEPTAVGGPCIFSSPHSGRVYPSAFLESTRLPLKTLRKSEDVFVEELIQGAASLGAPVLAARFPRAYLDVNREPYELDPELFADRLPDFANTRSIRVVGGLGTIARVVAESEEIYRGRLTTDAAFERINRLYRPYHDTLRSLLDRAQARFGVAVLIDCHSMPSASAIAGSGPRPHFVIGDRFGTSCNPALTGFLQKQLVARGYEVALNRPYAGGFITEHYGRPSAGTHALQLEINRSLYMDEETLAPRGLETIQSLMLALARALIDATPALLSPRAAAAE